MTQQPRIRWSFLLLLLVVVSIFVLPSAESFLLRPPPPPSDNTALPRRLAPPRSSEKTRLHGVLSKSAILRASRKAPPKPPLKPSEEVVSESFLAEAIGEALLRQESILEALECEHQKKKTTTNKENRRTNSIESRQREIHDLVGKLQHLQQRLTTTPRTPQHLEACQRGFVDLGFRKLLSQSPDAWNTRRKGREKEHGRPRGFDGLVFYSPRGVPILVGKPKAHKDETLRRISQGADLWFQVEGYDGARVLLRTSLHRGLRGSKECMQMAADLAAAYSDQRYAAEQIPVMYTDSKHVAKRGSKVGRMRQRKSLGRMYGYPSNVETITRNQDP